MSTMPLSRLDITCECLGKAPIFPSLIESAISGMLQSLDPHSSYLSADSYKDMQVKTKGKFGGLTDWTTEYLEAILSIKIVDGVIGAINHINKYSSNHTESIVTENKDTAEMFLSKINSSIVMHNASTQFADGGEFGFGGEVGISTNMLPPRGPVGLEQLVSFKYEISSKGKIRD